MAIDVSEQPELSCQWCNGTIPAGERVCTSCGSVRPRDDLVVPGLTQQADQTGPAPEEAVPDPDDDAERARQILRDLDAYIPEADAPARKSSRNPADDMIVVVGILVAGGVIGGLMGWLLLPPLLHELFENVVGVDSDGPEAFRRLGAFIGALVTMLFAALLATMLRR